jgi:hypothetical protein
MKTENEILEAIRAIDLWMGRNPGESPAVLENIIYVRDTLAWVVAATPRIGRYPPLDETVENQRDIDIQQKN